MKTTYLQEGKGYRVFEVATVIFFVLVLFAARTDLRRRDPAVLRLYDEAAPLPPLLLPPVLEGQMPPGLCRPQLLAVLVESGVLRPGQITVGTAES